MQELDTREIKWCLRVASGSTANLVFPPNDPESVRIAITKAQKKASFDIQLNQPRLKVKANHHYAVIFRARADSQRNIIVGFAKAHEPWDNMGLYRNIELKTEWQNFDIEFVATADVDNARIHFDVGESDISVELSSVSLRSLEDGKSIEPNLSAMQPGEPERDKATFEGTSDTLLSEKRKTAVRQQTEQVAAPKEVSFGTLRQVTPISRDWGWDRGLPIDRYYIENFLARYADNIRGRVLEIGDNSYTLRFGCDRVTRSDVLHVEEGNPKATIVADLTSASHIPSEIFDCILLIQTLQLIYDVRAAIQTIHRILKPGGVLLATFPGISQTYDHTWGHCWYWNFTTLSARRLFEEFFPAADVKIYAYGNVLASISFLHGLAAEELQKEELDYNDPGYEVLITVRAVKQEA
jgi:SAM-dependent methyltransferase